MPYRNDYIRDFVKILENLKPSKHAYEVFSDWLVMTAATLYSWKKDPEVEEEYMKVSKMYTPQELDQHSQLLAITVEALENIEEDFLGEVFTFAELTNTRNGQFFTPYNVSYMMADMMIGNKPPDNRVHRISDPACGAGGMLIASAQVLKRRGLDFQKDFLYVGQDIDHRCARMTFIQLSLLGIPAVIICGDTLAMTCYWQRETIGYYLNGMDYRLRTEKMLDLIRNLEKKDDQEIKPILTDAEMEVKLDSGPPKQGMLF